jgi:hypothetical protein
MADTSVKMFSSGLLGAPILNGVAGSFIALLDACLINGYGLKSVDTLAVSANVATASISTGHSAEVDSVILIAGATPATLNGEWKVTDVTSTTISWVTSGIANQTATGTITQKMAPIGWGKAFTGTDTAAYRSSDVTGTRSYLRIDDTNPQYAKLLGYEVMSDINTGTGVFPTLIQQAAGLFWDKSDATDTTSRTWALYGDSKGFYVLLEMSRSYAGGSGGYYFGDVIPTKVGDPYCCVINAGINPTTYPSSTSSLQTSSAGTFGTYCPRAYTGIGGSVPMKRCSTSLGVLNTDSGRMNFQFPNPTDGGVYLAALYLLEGIVTQYDILRGTFAGIYHSTQNIPNLLLPDRTTLAGTTFMTGRKLRVGTMGTQRYPVFFDITGPWR